jgi:hypothetical protein
MFWRATNWCRYNSYQVVNFETVKCLNVEVQQLVMDLHD